MKTSEFKARLNTIGFELVQGKHNENFFMIKNIVSELVVADFYKIKCSCDCKDFSLDKAFLNLGADTQAQLVSLLEIYTSTPLDEREEPKKWYIKCPITGLYLNINNKKGKEIWSSDKYASAGWQAVYTRAEIEAFTFEHAHLIDDEVTE
ncbi:hypothetical protein EP56_08130 [Listeriaceae bacterium FSL A5-0209]|nr:hypothetical protein EP56_08130 [Listeriaceae bacterium FSL A5-0209]